MLRFKLGFAIFLITTVSCACIFLGIDCEDIVSLNVTDNPTCDHENDGVLYVLRVDSLGLHRI